MNNFHVYEAIGRGKHSVTLLTSFPTAPDGFSSAFPSLPPWIRGDRGGPGSSASDSCLFCVFSSLVRFVIWCWWLCGAKTVYKGRKKKTIEYFAVKSVDKSQRSKVLNEVSPLLPRVHRESPWLNRYIFGFCGRWLLIFLEDLMYPIHL
jgi:hypothetical protein